MRKVRATLSFLALGATIVVPRVAGVGPGVQAAQAATVRPAVTPADSYHGFPSVIVCNTSGVCGDVTLWLDTSTGNLHAEVQGDDLQGNAVPIPGAEVALQTSGYEDFRNVPYIYRAWVPSSGMYDWLANTQDVSYSAPGANWWWRACGYIGNGAKCTASWKFTYTVGLGWKWVSYP